MASGPVSAGAGAGPGVIPNPDDRSSRLPSVVGRRDVSLGFGGSSEPRGAGQRYRAARCPVERSHLQIVWLLSLGRSEREVAQVTGYGRRWVGEVARRYDEDGPGGLGDRRRGTSAPGRSWAPRARRRCGPRCPRRPPTAACGRVPRWRRGWRSGSAARCGRSAAGTTSGSSATARRCRGRGTPRRRAPRSRRRTRKARRGGGRASRAGPGRAVEVWAFDEHRLGLKPVLRRQWAPRGQRPVAVGRHRYEWLYLYGFVHPATGEVVWFVCSTVDAGLLGAVLAAFAAAVGAGEGKLIVLVLDNAGWHVSGDLVVPPGIELAFLPPSPPSCSRPSTCGRWRTRPWRTSTSPR